MIFNIEKIDGDEFTGYVESDQLSDDQLLDLGYNFGNADAYGRVFHIPIRGQYNGRFKDKCLELDYVEVWVTNPVDKRELVLFIDEDFQAQDFLDSIGTETMQDLYVNWYSAMIDNVYDSMRER